MDIREMAPDDLLTPDEMARLFRVDPKTVTRWASAGRFEDGEVVRLPSGHRRYKASAAQRLILGLDRAARASDGQVPS